MNASSRELSKRMNIIMDSMGSFPVEWIQMVVLEVGDISKQLKRKKRIVVERRCSEVKATREDEFRFVKISPTELITFDNKTKNGFLIQLSPFAKLVHYLGI
jgi:hypothetical protein